MFKTLANWAGQFRPASFPYGRFALAMVIGIAGGWLFATLKVPLPWMLGPLAFSTVAALLGAPVAAPNAARAPMLAVLGVMLGAGVSPDLVARAPQYVGSIVALVFVAVIGTGLCFLYFRKVGKFDRTTSFYSSVPGGLSEMILMGEHDGGSVRDIAVIHGGRILFVVLVIPFLIQFASGIMIGGRPPPGVPLLQLAWTDLLLFAATFAAGTALSTVVKSPTALFLGPLVVSAIVHGSGWTKFQAPSELVITAQLIIGLSLGCRFAGARVRDIGRSLLLSLGASMLLLSVAAAFAWVVSMLLHLDMLGLLLAYSPGGVAEMSLVALALHIDTALVVVHHLVRVFLVTLGARRSFLALQRLAGP